MLEPARLGLQLVDVFGGGRGTLPRALAQHVFHANLLAFRYRVFGSGSGSGSCVFGCDFGNQGLSDRSCDYRLGLCHRLNVRHLLVVPGMDTLGNRFRYLRGEQPDRPQCVVVARYHVIHFARVAVRVDHGDHGDAQLARFAHRDLLFIRVDDEDRIRQPRHVLDSGEIRLQVLALALEFDHFFLRKQIITAIGGHFVEFLESLYGFLYGDPVGQQAAQPALVHVEHRAALRLFRDCILRLALGANEEDDSAVSGQFLHEFRRLFEHLQRLLQIDNVDTIALTKDVFLHLRVPPLRLMPEVNACLEQLLHCDIRQSTSSVGLHPDTKRPRIAIPVHPAFGGGGGMNFKNSYQPSALSLQLNPKPYRLLNWKRLRAPFCPYFLRSLARGSRVTSPSAFSFARNSALNTMSARVMPSRTASACPATPPPHTFASTLKLAAVSVETSGRFAAIRCEGVTKYSSNALPLTLNSPLPGRRKTRAIAVLRRPVP